MGGTPAIALEKLRKSYGRRRGIGGVDLQVERGEVFGYLGPNGAGKTTTIRLLLGFIRPDGGQARLLGRDIRRAGPALHRDLGYMPGELSLYGRLTGRQLLRFVSSLQGRDATAGATLAERLDVDLDRPLHGLSQGNARKVGLILAFMHHPALAILDEPTNGLDPLVRQEFYRLLAEARASGRTVFLSSHNLSEVERVCDRVAIIRDGRIVAVEGVGELKARALRHVTIRFAAAAPDAAVFSRLPNLRDVSVSGAVLRCRVLGDMDPLLKAASRFPVSDFLSQEADLEEIFLTYYGAGDHVS